MTFEIRHDAVIVLKLFSASGQGDEDILATRPVSYWCVRRYQCRGMYIYIYIYVYIYIYIYGDYKDGGSITGVCMGTI